MPPSLTYNKTGLTFVFMLLMLLSAFAINAQTLRNGTYRSEDGAHTMIVKHQGKTLTTDVKDVRHSYESKGGSYYHNTASEYSKFYIRVVTGEKLYTAQEGYGETAFFYTGGASGDAITGPTGMDNCPVYDKYDKMQKAGEGDMIIVTGCLIAAEAVCTHPQENVRDQIKPAIQLMKAVMDDTTTCPCLDAISKELWDSVE